MREIVKPVALTRPIIRYVWRHLENVFLSRKRFALTKPTIPYLQWRYLKNAQRTWRAWQAQSACSDQVKKIAAEIEDRGIITGPAHLYLSKEGQAALQQASSLVRDLSESDETQAVFTQSKELKAKQKDYLVNVVPWGFKHSPDSPLLKVALDRELLQIVSVYFGMWPRLHAVGAWLNLPSAGDPKEAQLWHRDPEDMKIIKVFIYVNDVGPDNGPFCYIPRTHPFSSGAGIVPHHKDKKRILDNEMLSVFPRRSWVECTGPADTMIIADTVGFHRGGKPTAGTRLLITFTYTSATPFSKRKLQIAGTPAWISHPIQRWAL